MLHQEDKKSTLRLSPHNATAEDVFFYCMVENGEKLILSLFIYLAIHLSITPSFPVSLGVDFVIWEPLPREVTPPTLEQWPGFEPLQ